MAVRHPEAAPGGSTDGQVIPSRDPVADAIDVVLFCFTEKWWDWERDGFVQRTACLAERLAADPRVRGLLVVNAPSSIFAAVAKDRPAGAGLREARPGVFVLDHVRLLPRERHNSWAMIVNGVLHDRAFKRRLGEAISTLGMRDPIIWLSGPTVARYASVFPESTVVYDAVDEWSVHGGYRGIRGEVLRAYETIASRADLVFAHSRVLAERFEGHRPEVHIIGNGVDPARFEGITAVPEDMACIPAPRIGYVGCLQDRVDVQLCESMAKSLTEASLVLIGPVVDAKHFEGLRALPNVYLLGARSGAEVPAYLAACDVCVIPHVDSILTRCMDPMKLYEYIAAGKPVVTTPLESIVAPPTLVRSASDAGHFAELVSEATDGRWRVDEAARAGFLASSSWQDRIDEALRLITEYRMRRRAPVDRPRAAGYCAGGKDDHDGVRSPLRSAGRVAVTAAANRLEDTTWRTRPIGWSPGRGSR
jgi:glycosyltransferase involved in cell wall biosynthesis